MTPEVVVIEGCAIATVDDERREFAAGHLVIEDGRIAASTIVPPTSQNQAAIEADLATFAPRVLDLPMDAATRALEQLIRSYDPCISCATHFLKLHVERT